MDDIIIASDTFNATIYAEDTNLLIYLWSFHVDLQGNANNIAEL